MSLNKTHFVKAGERTLLEKASIYEGDLLQRVRSSLHLQFHPQQASCRQLSFDAHQCSPIQVMKIFIDQIPNS